MSKKNKLTPEQQKKVRDAIRMAKMRMTIAGEKPHVTLPKLKFMEKDGG